MVAITNRKPECVARGHIHKGRSRVVIAFDDEMFTKVQKLAQCEGTSFAEQVRCLVEWGLEEADRP